MRTRSWKIRARTALATAAGIVTLAAGGTLVGASPAIAAGSATSSTINVSHGSFTVVLPNAKVGKLAAADNVTAFHGFSTFQSITIQSQGFDLEGTIKGKLRTYDFKALYQVYNLPRSSGWKVWALSFKKDSSQSVLKETFRQERLIDVDIDIKFRVSAAALRGVSTLRVGFETLKLQLDGTTKDFTVVNGASGGGKDQDDKDVPVDFEPI